MLSDRTFGVEIEHGNKLEYLGVAAELRKKFGMPWANVCNDGSGVEVISPVLKGADGLAELHAVMSYLQEIGGTMGEDDGFHVHHHGPEFLADGGVDKARALLIAWASNQDTVCRMMPSRRNTERKIGAITFCKLVRGDGAMSGFMDDPPGGLPYEYDARRYHSLNLYSLKKRGTIEFRQHHGTWDFDRCSAWIKFGQRFIEKSLTGEKIKAFRTVRGLLTCLGMEEHEIEKLKEVPA